MSSPSSVCFSHCHSHRHLVQWDGLWVGRCTRYIPTLRCQWSKLVIYLFIRKAFTEYILYSKHHDRHCKTYKKHFVQFKYFKFNISKMCFSFHCSSFLWGACSPTGEEHFRWNISSNARWYCKNGWCKQKLSEEKVVSESGPWGRWRL